MSAPEIAYRIACTPTVAFVARDVPGGATGSTAQHVALVIACRWAQPDGRFIVRQTAIAAATGLSESSVLRAVKALRSVGVFSQLGPDEYRLTVSHLPQADGSSRPTDGRNRQQAALRLTGAAVPQTAGTVSVRESITCSGPPVLTGRTVPQTAPTVPQTAGAVAGTESLSGEDDVSVSLPSQFEHEGEGRDARAGEAPADDATPAEGPMADTAGETFTDLQLRQLRWLGDRKVLLVNPATGECLRREWLRLVTGLGADLVKTILDVRLGDYPSDFRKAAEPFSTQVEAARRATADRAASDRAAAERAADEAAQARHDRESAIVAQRQSELRAEEEARQRGPFLEQAEALLVEIDAAEPRRLATADIVAPGFSTGLSRLRAAVLAQRVGSFDLLVVRKGWPLVRARELPPEPAAEAEAPRSFIEPANHDAEPASP